MFGRRRAFGSTPRAAFRDHVIAAADASVRPADGDRVLLFGPNPLRILLIGSGIAVGYGVRTRMDALDGRLGTRIAAATGRGVIVNNEARHGLRLSDQLFSAVMSDGFGGEDLVVWSPNYLQMVEGRRATTWRREMDQLLQAVGASKPLLLVTLPTPVGNDPVVEVASRSIAEINSSFHAVARAHRNVVLVRPPDVFVRPLHETLFDADYYAAAGAIIAEAACHALPKVRTLSVPTVR